MFNPFILMMNSSRGEEETVVAWDEGEQRVGGRLENVPNRDSAARGLCFN